MANRLLYQELAGTIQVRLNCEKSGNSEWFDKHEGRIVRMCSERLPHGSGFDSGCTIDLDKSHGNLIVINSAYHAMDDNGYYDGWIDFTVKVRPHLIFGVDLLIVGAFGKHQDLRDYVYDCMYYALVAVVDEP